MNSDAKPPKRAADFAGSVFSQYDAALQRYIVRRLHGSKNARDLAQEVYLRLLRVEDPELVLNPQAYVYKVASHVVHEYRLRSRNERVTFDSSLVEELDRHPNHAESDPLNERFSNAEQLARVLEQLPIAYRTIYVLQKRDGCSYREIADRLGLSVHTVKKYMFRALARLRGAKWES